MMMRRFGKIQTQTKEDSKMSNASDFVLENGVLKDCKGLGGICGHSRWRDEHRE